MQKVRPIDLRLPSTGPDSAALATAAVVRGALALHDARDLAAADPAWLAGALVDECVEHEVALGSIGADEVPKRAAAHRDRFRQHFADRGSESSAARRPEAPRRDLGVDACTKQALRGIDV